MCDFVVAFAYLSEEHIFLSVLLVDTLWIKDLLFKTLAV